MKSISIVYNKPKSLKLNNNKEEGKSEIRKTANNFYCKVLDTDFLKNENVLEKERTQTARASRFTDRRTVISSLSISSIPTNYSIVTGKTIETKKINPQSIVNIRKSKESQIFLSLRIPENRNDRQESFGTQRSLNKASKHSKIKFLSKLKCEKEVTLVLSVDFIFNEHNFWGEECVEDAAAQTWRILSPLANIIWIVRSEKTFKKLLTFSQSKGLRLDGVVQIQPNKKESLTVSFTTLESEAKFSRGHKLVFVFCLKSSNDSPINEYDLRSSLPIVEHTSTFVHFVRIDMKDKRRIRCLKKVVSQELPEPFDLNSFLERKEQNEDKIKVGSATQETEEIDDPVDPTEQLEKSRKRLLEQFQQSFGLNKKIEGDSLNYIIGDILKRNYTIAKQICTYYEDFERIKEVKKEQISVEMKKYSNKLKKKEYIRPIYVWES